MIDGSEVTFGAPPRLPISPDFLARGARIFEAGQPTQALVEMERGLMFVMAISDGSSLAVLASSDCDTDLVAYEMTRMVEAVGEVLTPAVRAQSGF